jgi:hypothetical protein
MIVGGIVGAYNLWATVKDFHALPHSGGVMQQPARWMKIIRLLESENNRPIKSVDTGFDAALGGA